LDELISSLERANYGTYLTSVGGSGLGVLSPYDVGSHSEFLDEPATPPETPTIGDAGVARSHRAEFESKSVDALSEWADSRGRWLYV
jgi:hypothetical protein